MDQEKSCSRGAAKRDRPGRDRDGDGPDLSECARGREANVCYPLRSIATGAAEMRSIITQTQTQRLDTMTQ